MGKSSKVTVGYWYHVLYHAGLCKGPIDAFEEFRGGDKTAWKGVLTSSGTLSIDQPNLWGGEKDQGGIVSDIDVMFGEATQEPNAYLLANLGDQVPAWRGLATLVFKGGKFGAMNPYPQKPSYRVRKIKAGWDDDTCWYPETAEITLIEGDPGNAPIDFDYDGGESFPNVIEIDVGAAPGIIELNYATGPNPDKFEVWCDGVKVIDTGYHGRGGAITGGQTYQEALDDYLTGHGLPTETIVEMPGDASDANAQWDSVTDREIALFMKSSATPSITVKVYSPLSGTLWRASISRDASAPMPGLIAMNPAHVLYFSRTNSEMGREPIGSINDASFRAAADWFYSQGFGICTSRDPAEESPADFEKRICKLCGASLTRSLADGQWYLDIANGEYTLGDLPILTDDDILDFKESPSQLDNAINSMSVKYLDVATKEESVTAPVRALGLVAAFGTIHQTAEYPELPTADLALRVAERDLRATATPTRGFDLVCTRKIYSWRPNQYFRLQSPKRGIADMVCIVGQLQHGTLRSGAIKLQATQDIYALPVTTYVEHEAGVDTRPNAAPTPIATQRVIETPYVDLAASLPASTLAQLDDDAGFALALALDPSRSRNYTMTVSPDGTTYSEVATGEWCPTATVVGAADRLTADVDLAGMIGLDQVAVGSAALWDDEIVRVDALDTTAGTATVARGCADTVPATHAAGSRIWFYRAANADDTTEYTAGESISVKLLTNTGSQQLRPALATAMTLELAQRAARPYPPANVKIAGLDWPAAVDGEFAVTWAHRNRETQADQLVDTAVASITQAADVRYGLRFQRVDTSAVLVERSDIGTNAATVILDYTGNVSMTLWSLDDIGDSLQQHAYEFGYTPPPDAVASTIVATTYVPDDGATIVDGGGDDVDGGGDDDTDVPAATLSYVQTLEVPISTVDILSGSIYGTAAGKSIRKYNASTYALVSGVNVSDSDSRLGGFARVGTDFYVAAFFLTNALVKVPQTAVDTNNPALKVSYAAGSGQPQGLCIVDGYAWISLPYSATDKLARIDVSSMTMVDSINVYGQALASDGTYLYAAAGDGATRCVRIADGAVVWTSGAQANVCHVLVVGGHVWVQGSTALNVYDAASGALLKSVPATTDITGTGIYGGDLSLERRTIRSNGTHVLVAALRDGVVYTRCYDPDTLALVKKYEIADMNCWVIGENGSDVIVYSHDLLNLEAAAETHIYEETP